ncbi:MAG TPA: TetR/AcrR family transcriptional regulator [Terriglobales bacterium]|nr:TetR/AcrR family transcriptional regulator [Terriglobales bacterium]
MARREDRRVQRTRELLQGALLALIREKGFEALTVQDIIDRANVGRATFYAHFDNKEDLLLSGFDTLRAALKKRQREAQLRRGPVEEQTFAFSHELFAHVNDHRDLFHAMAGKRSGAVVQSVVHKLLLDLVRDDVKALSSGKPAAVPAEAFAQFIAGAMFGLIMWWMGARTRPSVDDMNRVFRRLAIAPWKAAPA